MIGLVVVSHSRALAQAAVDLADQMVDQAHRPRTAIAAGLDDGSLGTDAMAVSEAILEVDGPEGVLVLLDLGSALLSAEMALELVDPEVAARVQLTAAPLVEGLVAAMVAASTDASLAAVAHEAGQGLAAKQEHLGTAPAAPSAPEQPTATGGATYAHSMELVVPNPHGLHARPAAAFVRMAGAHDAVVRVRNLDTGRGPVDARSLSGVATLDARQGNRLRVEADGPAAEAVLTALKTFAAQGFGDDKPAVPAATPQRPAGSGLDVAIGPAIVQDAAIDVSGYVPGPVTVEQRRLTDAVAAAREQLNVLADPATSDSSMAAVFDAHRALLDDPDVIDRVRAQIEHGQPATGAWADRLEMLRDGFVGLSDAYQRERAQDVVSVQRRVLAALVGSPIDDAAGDVDGVLITDHLDPATAASLDATRVVGVVTLSGGATGHGVLIARSRGVPIITDRADLAGISTGDVVAFDAATGRLVVQPDAATVAEFEGLLQRRTTERDEAVRHAHEPVVMADGRRIHVMANIASVDDAREGARLGADGAGLIRTEVLFGDWKDAPTVQQQVDLLTEIAQALDGLPITVRTWDVGGDKPLAFWTMPTEANPFLGARGIRAFRTDPTLLIDQIEAVCRVAQGTPARVMFPMVTTPGEVDWALEHVATAMARLGPSATRPQVGVMIEVPAAALRAADLTAHVDFVSIGTNDLTQYVMAAERGNASVATLLDPGDPSVMRLIEMVSREVRPGVEVGVCGGAASQPALAERLVALGVEELSADPPAIPRVKARLRAS